MRYTAAYALVPLIVSASACGDVVADPNIAETTALAPNTSAACALATEAVIEGRFYREEQIAGCDGGGELEEYPGLANLRLDAHCREEICGSVLLGWYFVDVEAGRVFDTNYEHWAPGFEIAVGSHGQDAGILESAITMPEGADPIHDYRRHYAKQEDGRIVGVYVRSTEGEAMQWHNSPEDLPSVLDGGCMVVNVSCDPATETVERIFCNGSA